MLNVLHYYFVVGVALGFQRHFSSLGSAAVTDLCVPTQSGECLVRFLLCQTDKTIMTMKEYTMDQYSVMTSTQRKRLTKDELAYVLNNQIGEPGLLPEDTLRNIIKDTIERTIDEKIPNELLKTVTDMKRDCEAISTENKMLKKTILEQQKFLEGLRRDKLKDNIFMTGIPESYTINENVTNDKNKIIEEIISRIDHDMTNENYLVKHIFNPTDGRTKYSAKITFNSTNAKMSILRNAKRLGHSAQDDALRKVFVRSEDPPLTRKENKRLADKLRTLKSSLEPDSNIKYKLLKGKLLENETVIDQFNLFNQLFC